MAITALVQLREKKEVVEETVPVIETAPQPEPAPVVEKKKVFSLLKDLTNMEIMDHLLKQVKLIIHVEILKLNL